MYPDTKIITYDDHNKYYILDNTFNGKFNITHSSNYELYS